jgi:hypothetical protein
MVCLTHKIPDTLVTTTLASTPRDRYFYRCPLAIAQPNTPQLRVTSAHVVDQEEMADSSPFDIGFARSGPTEGVRMERSYNALASTACFLRYSAKDPIRYLPMPWYVAFVWKKEQFQYAFARRH